VRRAIIATIALILSAAASLGGEAQRTDPDLQFWNGPYAGFLSGIALGSSTASTTVGCIDGAYICDQGLHGGYQANGAFVGAKASGTATQIAPLAGIVAGYDWRMGDFVTGIDSGLSLTPLSVTNGGSGVPKNLGLANTVFTVGATATANWLATFTGRVGYVVAPNVMIYGTGGIAITDLTVSNLYADTLNVTGGYGHSSKSSLQTGYAIGAGAEVNVGDGWQLRGEYLVVGFGTVTTSGGISIDDSLPNPFKSTANLSAQMVRIGLTRGF
jgi:outer membrane immunogenic protein